MKRLAEREVPQTAREEWKRNWPLVATAAAGISLGTVAIYSLGQFMAPLETKFGWSRTETSIGASIQAFVVFALSPFVGRLVDRTNVRKLALCGAVICSLTMVSFSFIQGQIVGWLALWCLYALGATLIAPTVWLAAVMGEFRVDRNLPMAMALCGSGLGSALAPPAAHYLIEQFGWRSAYQVLGFSWGGICILLALLFFFDRRKRGTGDGAASFNEPERTPLREVLGSAAFIKLALAVFAATLIISAAMLNLAPMLVDGGLSRAEAATVASLAGVGAIVGKPLTGWLLDRFPSVVATSGIIASLAVACLMLENPSWHPGVLLGCLALGVAGGSMVAAMACVSAQVFKPGQFGTAFGSLTSVMSLSAIIGPTAAGMAHDAFSSYAILLWGGIGIAIGAGLLLATLRTRAAPAPAN
jgi:MFS family permease